MHDLDSQEVCTIRAALRFYQQEGMGEPNNRSDDIHDIATDNEIETSLDSDGVGKLYEKITREGNRASS